MNDLFSVRDKQFLITGGTRGIGRALSLHFARQGAQVHSIYVRGLESATELEEIARDEKLRLSTLRADISTSKGVNSIMDHVNEQIPSLDALIHCAATGVHKPFNELTLRHFDFTYAVNVRAFFELSRSLISRFSNPASIVAMSSAGATRAVDEYTLTGSSKGALESMARHMAAELVPQGIRVNILSPGTTLTDAWKVLPHSEDRIKKAAAQSPAGRLTELSEIASAAHFLCCDASKGVVGQTLVVDSGCRIME